MIEPLIERVRAWADGRADVRALALVGSHARGDARPDSDVDLVLLVERPLDLTANAAWVSVFGEVTRLSVESWGRVTSVRAWYADGIEVEFGTATPAWGTEPDDGTRRVVRDGIRVLLDRDGVFARLVGSTTPTPRDPADPSPT